MDVSVTSRARKHLVFWNFLTWTTLICGVISQTTTFDNVIFTCPSNLTTRSFRSTEEVPIDRQRNSFAFAGKACSDAHVILKNKTADVYLISLGNSTKNMLFVRSCNPCTPFSSRGKHDYSSENLACGEFKTFNVSWEMGVFNVSQLDGNKTFRHLLTWNDSQKETDIDSVVLTSWSEIANDSAEWTIDDCSQTGNRDTEKPTTVSQGHLAGAVVAALIAGILLGGVGVYFGPDLWTIAKDRLPALRKRREKTKDEEELSDLFERKRSSTPDKSSTKEDATPEDESEAELPGRRRASPNAYTSCTVTKAPQPSRPTPTRPVTGKAADVKQTTDVKSGDDVRRVAAKFKSKKTENVTPARDSKPADDVRRVAASGPKSKKTEDVTSTRDSKPADDVRRVAAKGGKGKNPFTTRASGKAKKTSAKVEEEEPAEFYANEETNVYEGMKRDAPIYENRNTGVYESLNAGK